jgi:hypothetical protein
MMRWDIINRLIEENNYKSYLEIGYYKGWSFDNVKCEFKISVDPNPCKIEEQETCPYGNAMILPPHAIFKMTSDDFFKHCDSGGEFRDHKWDIIFIDGLHEAKQVTKDIENSLRYLSPGGTIVLHDCNPPKYEHTTTGIDGCWTGNVYKAFVEHRIQNDHLTYVIDTDWGIGIIDPNVKVSPLNFPLEEVNYDSLDDNRYEILNLISPEEFCQRKSLWYVYANETATNNNCTA